MKKIFCAVIAAAISLSAAGSVAFAEDEPVKITINDTELVIPEGDTHPFIEDGRTLVPMRAIFEALGTTVEWDGENRRVTANDPKNDTTIILTIDSNVMVVGNEEIELDVPAKIVNDRTMVPVRAIAESLGCIVDWDGVTRTVIIESFTYESQPIACSTLDELNENIRMYTPDKYVVANPTNPLITIVGYEYFPDANISQINCRWDVGAGADFYIRIVPGVYDALFETDKDVKKESVELAGEYKATLCSNDDVKYLNWDRNDFTFGVLFYNEDWDTTEVMMTIANDITEQIPVKGSDSFLGFRVDVKNSDMSVYISEGEKEGTYEVLATKMTGEFSSIQWRMICTYDAENGKLVYSDSEKVEQKDFFDIDSEPTVLATGSSGTFETEDGVLIWSDSTDKEESEGYRFIHERYTEEDKVDVSPALEVKEDAKSDTNVSEEVSPAPEVKEDAKNDAEKAAEEASENAADDADEEEDIQDTIDELPEE